jgi:hypothetical protein
MKLQQACGQTFYDLSRGLYFSKIKKNKILSYSYQREKIENWRKYLKFKRKEEKVTILKPKNF